MTAKKIAFGLLAASLLVLFSFGNTARAGEFSGKDVTMIVNYSAGGPTDIVARLFARYLPKYLPGIHGIIVHNVNGAGGKIGVNALGRVSKLDKLNLGFFTWNPIAQLIHDPALHVRYNDLKFIAGLRMPSIVYIRHDTPPGINRPADVVRARNMKVGVLSPDSSSTIRIRLTLDLLGAKYDTIPGYKGMNEIQMAIHRNDIQLSSTSLPLWAHLIRKSLVDTGIVMPLFQYDYARDDGTVGRNPDVPHIPTFLEVYRQVKGPNAMPSGERWQALELLSQIMDSMYETAFMPPNAPPAAVAEMRVAFGKLAQDPEFVARYVKLVSVKPHLIIGAKGDTIISKLATVSPSLLDFLNNYVNHGRY